jgi:hypothetical protein
MSFRTTLTALCIALVVAGGACSKQKLIPNTKVMDTPLNREVLLVVEKYRKAMERLKAAEILALVHPTYQDHAGTPQADDDIDYSGLKTVLASRFRNTTKIRYRIEYQDVEVKGNEALVDAYVDATFVYDDHRANPRWRRLTDYNRFRLLKDGDTWRFIGGL